MTDKDIEFNKHYWDDFYKHKHRIIPSQFCVCVLTELNREASVVELGSGNGRDSLYFASKGCSVTSMDLSHEAISQSNKRAEAEGLNGTRFFQGDLTSKKDISRTVDHARKSNENQPITFYSRFVMHSLDDEQEQAFLKVMGHCVKAGEHIYFEFRSAEDAALDKHFGGHFRRYVNTETFKKRLSDEGFKIEYEIIGQGMAKYKEEDPFVARFIAKKLDP